MEKISGVKYQDITSLQEIIYLVLRSNTQLAQDMRKKVRFRERVGVYVYTDQLYTLISILNNLIVNALDALPQEGMVEVGSKWVNDKEIQLWVADSGPGIRRGNASLIFDPGYTTKFYKDGSASTGIGLSHVHGLVKTLQGQIEVKTGEETDLKGAEFRVTIPVRNLIKGEGP